MVVAPVMKVVCFSSAVTPARPTSDLACILPKTARPPPKQAALGAAADAIDGGGKTPPTTTAVATAHDQGFGQEAKGVRDESATGARAGGEERRGEKNERVVQQLVRLLHFCFFVRMAGGSILTFQLCLVGRKLHWSMLVVLM